MQINNIYEEFKPEFLEVRRISIFKNGTVILHYKNKTTSYYHFKNNIPLDLLKLKKKLDNERRRKHELKANRRFR